MQHSKSCEYSRRVRLFCGSAQCENGVIWFGDRGPKKECRASVLGHSNVR